MVSSSPVRRLLPATNYTHVKITTMLYPNDLEELSSFELNSVNEVTVRKSYSDGDQDFLWRRNNIKMNRINHIVDINNFENLMSI